MFREYELKGKLASKGLTLSELARLIGINEATLSRKIKGKSEFNRKEMLSIKNILKLSMEEFESIFFAQELA